MVKKIRQQFSHAPSHLLYFPIKKKYIPLIYFLLNGTDSLSDADGIFNSLEWGFYTKLRFKGKTYMTEKSS